MSRAVYRIVWAPGSDRLVGTCHCGAEHTSEDPVLLWQWLLAHPEHPDSSEADR
jgi:hypothetical protein